MSGLSDKVEARVGAVRARVKARLARLLPGVAIREEGDRIELSGRGLVQRWVRSDELRHWREIEP